MTEQSLFLAVDPVPWARAQMAFTLAFHIILVPLGVSWAFMSLIANYRGIKRNDRDAMVLAERWSKYMAVTFAVGAVTGTVLSFEFGLLWPRFMGQWGDVFGIPFAFEGVFFFLEAIFISIYIYGWRRLKPWTHFLYRDPGGAHGHPGCSVGRCGERLDELALGVHRSNDAGRDHRGRPVQVIFNDAMPLMAAHMVIAAYVVGGFLIASVYAAGMLRGRRPITACGFLIPFSIAAVAIRFRWGSGTPGPLGLQQPTDQVRRHRARPDSDERCARDVARPAEQQTGQSPAASRSRGWPRGSRTRAREQRPSSKG